MTEMMTSEKTHQSEPITVPAFGYELIREILLPSLLGKETSAILYWAGKDLARKFPLQSIDEIIEFFDKSGWGSLTIKDETKNELQMELTSPLISERLQKKDISTFQLEAGFLAHQIETLKDVIAEAYEHPKRRAKKVIFTVKWDSKDSIE
ncbi:YslB family protein [Robertmurraya massiliosenegalensis]